jgi:hypothetical protein
MVKHYHGQSNSCSMSFGAFLLTLEVPKLAKIGYVLEIWIESLVFLTMSMFIIQGSAEDETMRR